MCVVVDDEFGENKNVASELLAKLRHRPWFFKRMI